MSIKNGTVLAISFDENTQGKLETMQVMRDFVERLKKRETHHFQAWATTEGSRFTDASLFAPTSKTHFVNLSIGNTFAVTEEIGGYWYGHKSAPIVENLRLGKTVVLNQTAPGIMKLREFEFQGERPKVIAVQLTVNPSLKANRGVYQHTVVHKDNNDETIRALMAIS